MYYAAFLLRLPTPMAATTTRPMTTATWPLKVGPVPEGRQAEVVAEGRAHYHAQYGDSGVAVAAAGEDELPQGAAAQHDGAETHQSHAQEIPQAVGVGHTLARRS